MAVDHPEGADTVAASRLPAMATSRLLALGALAKVADTEVLVATPVADWITEHAGGVNVAATPALNSDVLPDGSVAVEVTISPTATVAERAGLNEALPLPFVVAFVKPR